MTLCAHLFSASDPVFANDLGLIEARTLEQHISEFVVLDARPKAEWRSKRIPGALSFSWEDYTRTDERGIPHRIWPPQDIAKVLGSMGINEKTPIVVYGDADKSWGGEGWTCWVLSWISHSGPIRLLNGGIQAWKNNGFPLESGEPARPRKQVDYRFTVKSRIDITTSELEKQKSGLTLVDTRSTLEWLRGKIPGAVHIPWDDFYSGKERRPLLPHEFKQLLKKKGIDTSKTVVYYCAGGIRSAYAWLVHQLAGLPDAVNYEGGYEAWKRGTQIQP